MTKMQRRLAGWVLVLAGLLLWHGARAQGAEPEPRDPPGRVARVAEINGQVWVWSPDASEWVAASRNQPLTSGDRLATEPGARAELQIGSTSVRLDASSELELVQLDDEHVALELHDGSSIARVRDMTGAGQLELTTGEGRFIALRSGTYRFDRNNGRSDITVYNGQARYEGPNSGLPVDAGQRAEFWIDSGGVAQYSTLSPVNDAFAAWSSDRDRRFVGAVAERYVSPEMTGAAELDAYGRWEQTPDYGSVWIPTAVAVDWAPYSQGRWTYVRPWGWTWVDAAPWGFAPFHYGRWVYLRNNWCWTPGTRVARPVYAPALVGWVGGGRGSVSVTVGGGPAVGWFPLAPREVYVPSYRVSPRYARNVNITTVTNVTVINNVFSNPQGPREFENRRFPRAITVVPADVMAERLQVGPAAAQYRHTPGAREFGGPPGRTAALLAPQIATPPMPSRGNESRAVRPPPGVRPDAGERPGLSGAPGSTLRDRNEADRDRDRRQPPSIPPQAREPERAGAVPGQRPPGFPAQQPAPGLAPPAPAAMPSVNGVPPGAGRSAMQAEPGMRRPDERGPGRFQRDRDGHEPGQRLPQPQITQPQPQITQPQITQPQPQPVGQPPRPTPPPVQEGPMMRPLPVQRGEERRQEERRFAPRPETPITQPAEQRPAPPARVERPAAPMTSQPIAPQQVAPRPVEPPRPVAPAAAPAPPRIEAPRPEQPRSQRQEPRGDDQKRGEPREPR